MQVSVRQPQRERHRMQAQMQSPLTRRGKRRTTSTSARAACRSRVRRCVTPRPRWPAAPSRCPPLSATRWDVLLETQPVAKTWNSICDAVILSAYKCFSRDRELWPLNKGPVLLRNASVDGGLSIDVSRSSAPNCERQVLLARKGLGSP